MEADHPPAEEPAATAVHRSRGTTASERLLADLGDAAFLDLWSYPNLFYDKKQGGKGDGKELCDMLVVCGDDLIIFSDKHIKYQEEKPLDIAWPRYYRKAVQEAVKQINGANRILSDFPEKIYTDPGCTQRLPITLPPAATRRTHGVVVASGASKAVQTHHKDDSGSFIILPSMKGDAHLDVKADGYVPFTVGDVNPNGMFIHVFDDVSIKRVLTHLDTISDFTQYLSKRAIYLRSNRLLAAHGEEELLAHYLNVGMKTGGAYDFELKRKHAFEKHLMVPIQGEWSAYVRSKEYFAKALADEKSRVWDKLIGVFTENVLSGTSVSIMGEAPSATLSERALRYMAREGRFSRRVLGEAVSGFVKASRAAMVDRYARVVMPSDVSADPTVAYVFMTLAFPAELEAAGGLPGGYEQYRQARVTMLRSYCVVLLSEQRQIKTAIGIAVDAHWTQTGRRGGSEDLMAIQVDDWNEQMLSDVARAKEELSILLEDRLINTHTSHDEYPALPGEPPKRRWPKHKTSRERFRKK
jgi:hypothetical protein